MARPQRAALLLLVSVSISGWLSSGADAAASPKSPDDTPLVGAYYFSWYNLEQQWEKFPRSDNPTLGEYDQSDPKVVTQHHAWAKRGGIDFFAMAWSGAGSKHVEWERADEIDRRVTKHLDEGSASGVKVALMYNIRDIVAAGKNGKVDLSEGNYCSIFRDNMMHAASTHWLHPSYLKIAGSPVLFLYTLRDYINYRDCLKLTFQGIKNSLGVYPYIVADTVWWSPSPHKMDWGGMAAINVSAVTGFNTFDAGQPEKMEQSFSYYSSQLFHEMAAPAWSKRIQVIPTILPGFDDRKLRGDDRVAIDRAGGAEFVTQWKQMLWFAVCQPKLLRAMGPLPTGRALRGHPAASKTAGDQMATVQPIMMINSFNEWHDASAIEPSQEYGDQFLRLLASLKAEIPQEDLECVKAKDVHYQAPKYIVPSFLRVTSKTPGDEAFIKGISIVAWFMLMWISWNVFGRKLLEKTGGRPQKVKDDDAYAIDGFSLDPSKPSGGRGGRGSRNPSKVPPRTFTVQTWATILFVGTVSYLIIIAFLAFPPVARLFASRRFEYDRHVHTKMKSARAHAATLCPELVHTLHQQKFEEWVQKLAANQISPSEFKAEMCGDSPKHYEQVEALYLEFLGRVPENKGMLHYVQQIEAADLTLMQVKQAIANSQEATEWAAMKQMERVVIPKDQVRQKIGFQDAMKQAKEGLLASNRAANLAAFETIETKVEEMEAAGDQEGVSKLIQTFFQVMKTSDVKLKTRRLGGLGHKRETILEA